MTEAFETDAIVFVINNPECDLAQLMEIAEFFRKTEPHSPVTFLIQQAVRWAETPLDKEVRLRVRHESGEEADLAAMMIRSCLEAGRLSEVLGRGAERADDQRAMKSRT